jgi:predicted nucleotidyltransferase
MDATTQEDLTKIKDAILRELNDVEAIYVFGSVAKGTQNEKSDYDIVIFVKDLPDNKTKKISGIRYGLLGKIKRPLELFLLCIDDLEYKSPFIYEVFHNHGLIHGKDVISRYKDVVKEMKPLVLNGVKVGYYV